jgi:ABC-type nitrate/sulfonate/bicarbonate transport system substrate-binding protein
MRQFSWLFRLALCALAITLGVFGATVPVRADSPKLIPVKIGVLPNDDMVSVLYALRTGMFARAGLDVQLDKTSPNGAAIAAAVSAGAYDIGKSSITPMFDAYLHGVPFWIIGTASIYESKKPYAGILVPKDSGITSVKDFVGKPGVIGLSFVHNMTQLAIVKELDEAGLDYHALKFVEIPMSTAMAAMDQGRVIAAEASLPPMQAALDTGRFRLLAVNDAIAPAFTYSVWFVRKDFAKEHPDVVRTFNRVQTEAAKYTNAHPAETVQMLSDFNGVPAAVIARMQRVTNGTGITAAGVQPVIDAEAKYGYIAHGFNAQDLIDPDVLAK